MSKLRDVNKKVSRVTKYLIGGIIIVLASNNITEFLRNLEVLDNKVVFSFMASMFLTFRNIEIAKRLA